MKRIIQMLVIIAIALFGMAGAQDAGAGAGDAGGLGGIGGGFGGLGDGFGGFGFGDFGGAGIGAPGAEVSVPGWLSGADGHMPGDGPSDGIGAPGMEFPAPDFGEDAWISANFGGTAALGYAGLGMDVAHPEMVMIFNNTTQQVTFYNPGQVGMDVGGLRLVRETKNGTLRQWTDLLQMPYVLVVNGGGTTTLDLDVPVGSGDKILLTNGVGIYNGMKIP